MTGLVDPLDGVAALRWPGSGFVAAASPSGRLAVLLALGLGARSGHDYLGCEHLVAGAIRAGGLPDRAAATTADLRRVAVVAVAASQRLAQMTAAAVEAWFDTEVAGDPSAVLASIRFLPTLTPRASAALDRARGQAAAGAALGGPGAVHVLSGVLADPGIVAPAAVGEGVDLVAARGLAERRAGWGALADLVVESVS